MKTYRSMTAAALVAAVGTVGALSIGSALGQQGTQPGQRPTTPGQPTTQPGQRPTTPPGQERGAMTNERLFALEGAGAERQIQQLGQRLNQIEQQMQRTNQQLSQRVSQLENMEGEQKIDAITSVLEEVVNEHEQLHTYLVELRSSLTGQVGSPGGTPGTPGQPNRPGQPDRPGQPGQSPR